MATTLIMTLIQRIKSDLSLPCWCLVFVCLIYSVSFAALDGNTSQCADLVYRIGSCWGLSWWLWDDARRNHFVLPMSYGLLFLMMTPVFAPLYLFETRGRMAFVTLALYGTILAAIVAIYMTAYMVLH